VCLQDGKKLIQQQPLTDLQSKTVIIPGGAVIGKSSLRSSATSAVYSSCDKFNAEAAEDRRDYAEIKSAHHLIPLK
jgi:hypothetical protein